MEFNCYFCGRKATRGGIVDYNEERDTATHPRMTESSRAMERALSEDREVRDGAYTYESYDGLASVETEVTAAWRAESFKRNAEYLQDRSSRGLPLNGLYSTPPKLPEPAEKVEWSSFKFKHLTRKQEERREARWALLMLLYALVGLYLTLLTLLSIYSGQRALGLNLIRSCLFLYGAVIAYREAAGRENPSPSKLLILLAPVSLVLIPGG